jgi:hypothetical protein
VAKRSARLNAATKINKLLQISGGAVYTDTGEVLEFDVSNRLNAVLEVIEEASNKVLVFVPFTHTIELLRAKLEKAGIAAMSSTARYPVNRKRSRHCAPSSRQPKNPHVLIIQPQAASTAYPYGSRYNHLVRASDERRNIPASQRTY